MQDNDWLVELFFGVMIIAGIFLVLVLFIVFLGIKSVHAQTIIKKHWVSIGTHEVTCYHAVKTECGNGKGIGYYGKQIAKHGKPLGNYCAANFLKPHTRIKIPALYGQRVFEVEDRLSAWVKTGRVDILVPLNVKGQGLRRAVVLELK